MAHFAKLDKNNVVVEVHVLHNDTATSEQVGVDFLNHIHKTNDVWKQTSYNTYGGVHLLDGTPFRKNYAGKGHIYDEERDAFYKPSPYPSWILNEITCVYEPPTPYPPPHTGPHAYDWNEETTSWELIPYTGKDDIFS